MGAVQYNGRQIMRLYHEDATGNVYARIDGWTINTYETEACGLAQVITSPASRTAGALWIGIDGRLSDLRTRANIEFYSMHGLKLTDALVDRMILAATDYVDRQVRRESEFALTQV